MEISELQSKIEQLQYELNIENQRGALKDAAKVADLEQQIADMTQELEVEQKAAQYAQSKQEATAQITTLIDSLDWKGVPPKEIFLNYSEESAIESLNYFSAVVQNAFVSLKQADLLRIKDLEDQLEISQESNRILQERIEDAGQAYSELERINSDLELSLKDAEAKKNAAVLQLEEAKKRIEQVESWNDDLQKQVALGVSASMQVVDADAAHEKYLEQRRKEEEAKPAIYNIRWKDDLRRDTYQAELAETDATIEFSHITMHGDIKNPTAMKGKYRVVTREDAATFRAEYLAKQTAEQVDTSSTRVLEVEEQPVTVPAFQEDSATSGLDQTDASGEMAGKSVEERLQALELAVFGTVRDAA